METTFQDVTSALGIRDTEGLVRKCYPGDRPCADGIVPCDLPDWSSSHEEEHRDIVRRTTLHRKSHPTFSDALVLVRRELWRQTTFYGSPSATETVKVPKAFVERLTQALCCAA